MNETEMLVKLVRERFARIFVSDPLRTYKYSSGKLDKRLKSEAAILVLLDKRGKLFLAKS